VRDVPPWGLSIGSASPPNAATSSCPQDSPDAMGIRQGTPQDREVIVRIARASFDRVYAFFAVRASRGAWPLLIAEEGGVAVGFLEGRLFEGAPPIGYVYFVAVDSAHRRQSLGRLLVEEALRAFAAKHATRVFAAVPEGNEASMGLFTALGFREAPEGAMWRWYGWRGILTMMRMVIAPHEILFVRTSD